MSGNCWLDLVILALDADLTFLSKYNPRWRVILKDTFSQRKAGRIVQSQKHTGVVTELCVDCDTNLFILKTKVTSEYWACEEEQCSKTRDVHIRLKDAGFVYFMLQESLTSTHTSPGEVRTGAVKSDSETHSFERKDTSLIEDK